MEVIGFDDDWALVCPHCTAVIKYTPDEIESHCVCEEFGDYADGLICPHCGKLVLEHGNRKRLIPLEILDNSTLFAALHDTSIVVVPCKK